MLLTSLLRIFITRSFRPFVFESEYDRQLEFESLEDLGLYVHIPFCRSICSFCPYCKVLYSQTTAAAYRDALLREIELVCRNRTVEKKVTSLYFGGGTPALMIDDLKTIIDRLKQFFVIQGGIGVELHPEDLTDETLLKLKSAGVSMVSLGIQSFDDQCLEKLGRSGADLVEKLERVKRYEFDVVDVDLIFAIPGQTDEILATDLKTAFDHGATQVSTYPFIDFTFADNTYKPMSRKVKKAMLKQLTISSAKLDTERTSVWTFARRGTGKYSSVTRDAFLGFGVSATSLLQSSFKINTFSIDAYIQRINEGQLPTSLTVRFTKRQRAAYFLFWSVYAMGVDPDKFQKIVGAPLNKMYGLEIFLAEMLGFLSKNGHHYQLTDRAAAIYHDIEQSYTTAYIDKMWNVSRVQPFPERLILK
jgi:oxygen-independent coproporphyrinogen-3 oxidase